MPPETPSETHLHMLSALFILGALVIGYGAVILVSSVRRSRIKIARAGFSPESFAEEFEKDACSQGAIKMAYTDLTELSGIPVCRNDDLEKMLGLLPEDFELMFEERCRRLGLIDVWQSPHAALLPLKTAEDYVRFLSAVMDGQSKAAGR